MLSLAAVLALAASSALAQKDGPAPALNPNPTDTTNPRLVGKAFPFNALPFMVDTSSSPRGTQQGYNLCNSTTEGQNSMCQTLIVNDLPDFCLWAPPISKVIGDSEGEVVAWCTKKGHGTRLIPAGTITGAQFIKTPSYIEFTGFIKQENLNLPTGDFGGELDSGGQDLRGNPIGGVAYSNNMPATTGQITQSRVWHQFIGGNQFCMKFCDNTAPNAAGICRHTLDTVGCNINVPASYQDNVFLSCEGDDQLPVALTNTLVPASRNCKTFASTDLWPDLPAPTVVPPAQTSSPSTTTGAPSVSGKPNTASKPVGGSNTASSEGGSPTDAPGDASSLRSTSYFVVAAIAGLVGAAVFA